MERLDLQYISKKSGTPVAVIIPIKQWKYFEKKHKKLEEYHRLKEGIKSAFKELQQIKQGKVKAVTLKEFLDEC